MYSEVGNIAISSGKSSPVRCIFKTLRNCRRKRNNHTRPLSLTWQTPCQIKRKYNNHSRMELAICTFLRLGAGSGRGSFEDRSYSSSCSDTSGQISSSVLSASDNSVLQSSDKSLFASLQSPELASFSVT